MGEYEQVLSLVKETERVFTHDVKSLAKSFHFKGLTLCRAKRYDEAFEAYQKTYTLYLQLGDRLNLIVILFNLANVEFWRYRFSEAHSYYQQVIQEYSDVPINQYYQVTSCKNRVKVLLCMGEIDQAKEVLASKLDLVEQVDERSLQAQYWFLMAFVCNDRRYLEELLQNEELDEKLLVAGRMLYGLLPMDKAVQTTILKQFPDLLVRHQLID